jgi:hypothetical protein
MKTYTIDVQVGIYNADYVIRDYGTHIIVTAPYIKWCNNSGSLSTRKVRIDKTHEMDAVRRFCESNELLLPANNNAGALTLEDVIDGNMHPLVKILNNY